MVTAVALWTFTLLQEEIGWDPVVRDHRSEEMALFVLGTAVVAAIVIVRRIARRERPANRRMLE